MNANNFFLFMGTPLTLDRSKPTADQLLGCLWDVRKQSSAVMFFNNFTMQSLKLKFFQADCYLALAEYHMQRCKFFLHHYYHRCLFSYSSTQLSYFLKKFEFLIFYFFDYDWLRYTSITRIYVVFGKTPR